MANLKEMARWEQSIYQIDLLDPVLGGENGITNLPLLQLANRTLYLKKQAEYTQALVTPKSITANSANAVDAAGHSHEIALASTTTAGIVQLNDSLTSNANDQALTAKQGKKLNTEKLAKAGDTMTGALQMPTSATSPATSTPFAISYGRVQSYSNIYINANTDNSNTSEYVLLTAGKGISSNKADGLAVGPNYLQWLGVSVATVNSNVASATKLHTARTVSFSGAATGSFSYDGTTNGSCVLTLADSGVRAGSYGNNITIPVITVNDKGLITGASTHVIRSASTNQAGIVQLVDNLTSNANNQALTAKQGKVLNDTKLGNTGTQTLNGQLITTNPIKINNPSTWAGIEMVSGDGSWILEANPAGSVDRRLNFKFLKDGENSLFIAFAKIDKNETVAYQSWVQDGFLAKTANAASATKLHASHTINGVVFDGTANITVGLPTFSTTINQATLTLQNADDAIGQGGFTVRHLSGTATNKPSGISHAMMTCAYDTRYASQLAADWRTNKLYSRTSNNGQWTSWKEVAYTDSNVASATKLQTARNIAMTGDGTWSASFDGTNNVSATLTLANTGVRAGSYNSVTVDAKGRVIAGLTQTHGLITATSATGTTNTATNNNNTFLNIVASGVGSASSVGSSTQITGANGINVSSDTAGKLIISQTIANNLTDNSATKPLSANMGKVLDGTKLGNSGTQHLDGILWVGQSDTWQKITFKDTRTNANRSVDLEINPSYFLDSNTTVSSTEIKFRFNDATRSGNTARYITFPSINNVNQNVAYHSWVQHGFLAKTANAVSASKLQTPRQISLSGAVTGSVNFDGSGNVIIPTTLTKAVVREYNRTINGTATGQTTNTMQMVGQVVVGADGRITQYFHLKHFRDFWFLREDNAVGYQNNDGTSFVIPIVLWTAMPNKILSVTAQTMRSTNPTSSAQYQSEAAEHVLSWDKRKTGNATNQFFINISRFRGGSSEHIDLFLTVEGY